jgi:alkanesulfonate monooxygenase SsuD/methylene tetrahydromethanopterin reductase-like flavin-dependent oxidoreductase (luciferase family)
MTTPLKFGLSLPNRAVLLGMPIELLYTVTELADQSHYFDSVWVGDNLLSKARLEALVTLGALAARTRRVKLGTICLASFTLRQPLLLAIQWASLDLLSGGRTILAVCLGGAASKGPQFAAELGAMGIKSAERVPRLEEGIDLLRQFWGTDPVNHAGQFYTFTDINPYPKPAQLHVPIIIAVNPPLPMDLVNEERALRRVARIADGWQSDGVPPEVFRARWSRIREYAAEYGRTDAVADASLHLMVNINDDAAFAHVESVTFLERYYGKGAVTEEKLASWLAFGSPEAVIDKIEQFVEAGCTTVVLRFTSPDQRGQIERCIAEVLPAFANRIELVTAPAGAA